MPPKSIKQQTLWNMAPLLVVTALNLASVPLFYRNLGADLYALMLYVTTLSGFFGFADFGLGVAVGRYVGVELGRGDLEKARSYWGTGNLVAFPLVLGMASTFALIGWVFGPRWYNVAPDNVVTLRWAFVAAGAGLFFSYYAQLWNILTQVNLDFPFVSLLRLVAVSVQLGGAIVLAALTRDAALIIAWSSFLAGIQLVALIWHARRRYCFGFHWRLARWARLREMRRYTTKIFLTLLANNLLGGLDRLALGRLAPPADFAHYAICTNAGQRVNGLSVSVMGPVFGQSSRAVGAGGAEKVGEIYEESFELIYGWLVLVAVWAVVWRHTLLTLWLGSDLAASVAPLFPPIMIAFCITALANISTAQLGPLNRVGLGLVTHSLAGAVFVISVYLGWKWTGVIGVAYGFLVSRIAFLMQDVIVTQAIHARGWLNAERVLHLGLQCVIGASFWLLLMDISPSLPTQIVLALFHALLIAGCLLRKEITTLRHQAGSAAK